jgi:FkbM family methyltransferase
MNFNGQNLEDKIVWDFFQTNYGSDFKGTVLDLGANDGLFLSNSWVFIESGWKGYLVEAGRTPFERLSALYNNSNLDYVLLNYAISTENGLATFYESGSLISNLDCGLVSSIIPSETEKWRKSGTKFESYQVNCRTFDELFGYGSDNYSPDLKFDFISIDIEGMDYEILTQIDLIKYKCKCLCVEFNGVEKQKYVDYANSHGMNLIHENAENLIFVNTSYFN